MSRTVVSSYDEEEAEEHLGRVFPGLAVSVEVANDALALAYRNVVTPRFSINRLRSHGRLRAVGALAENIAVGRRLAGSVAIRHGDRAVDTSRPYLRPIARSALEMDGAEVALITLAPSSLADYLDRSGDGGTLAGRLQTAPHLRAWELVMDHALGFLDAPEAMTADVERELHDLLCWSLIRAFPDPWAETGRLAVGSAVLRRALLHIEEHADDVVTMPEVAEAARISVRALEYLFRRELGTTPRRWLRDIRLDRVRHDLATGAATGTIAEIAARHGLPHPGRFAADYLARFGELPAATRRGRAVRPVERRAHQRH